jgi:hypothetical protein
VEEAVLVVVVTAAAAAADSPALFSRSTLGPFGSLFLAPPVMVNMTVFSCQSHPCQTLCGVKQEISQQHEQAYYKVPIMVMALELVAMVVSMPVTVVVIMVMIVVVMLFLQKVRDRVQKDVSEHTPSCKGKHGPASNLKTLWRKDEQQVW